MEKNITNAETWFILTALEDPKVKIVKKTNDDPRSPTVYNIERDGRVLYEYRIDPEVVKTPSYTIIKNGEILGSASIVDLTFNHNMPNTVKVIKEINAKIKKQESDEHILPFEKSDFLKVLDEDGVTIEYHTFDNGGYFIGGQYIVKRGDNVLFKIDKRTSGEGVYMPTTEFYRFFVDDEMVIETSHIVARISGREQKMDPKHKEMMEFFDAVERKYKGYDYQLSRPLAHDSLFSQKEPLVAGRDETIRQIRKKMSEIIWTSQNENQDEAQYIRASEYIKKPLDPVIKDLMIRLIKTDAIKIKANVEFNESNDEGDYEIQTQNGEVLARFTCNPYTLRLTLKGNLIAESYPIPIRGETLEEDDVKFPDENLNDLVVAIFRKYEMQEYKNELEQIAQEKKSPIEYNTSYADMGEKHY